MFYKTAVKNFRFIRQLVRIAMVLPVVGFIGLFAYDALGADTYQVSARPTLRVKAPVRQTLSRDEQCLQLAIYYEAGFENMWGKMMVAKVILNRVASRRFPNSVCAVVKQKYQFSFYWEKKNPWKRFPPKKKGEMWHVSGLVAHHALRDLLVYKEVWQCAQYYKRTDNVGVSKRSQKFFSTLVFVGTAGEHSVYCDPRDISRERLYALN
ncbi:hypothetical protein COU17_01075 [Candidatus Kaiserbacteria bacterium CG10_big_fil_rev_8_21_14_0_10_49_17]|uniref:Cell wall hydrolase SleB domain-containing protein n=1 Tax=Candidatus Kaiserbacteria bacterium CG10_big_fil_rev_8_21_14_0_10_49_17 TaxID=1974609 RepID=A0A2M6WF27_9BACT|nr:MAG: hypothetical protein COU17_01075 [Candidatus Kaiserbacteria bacterium CG10_big_fil_rev_8_21_14_0_10_49_17]